MKIDKKQIIVLTCYVAILITISVLAYNHKIPAIITKIPYYDIIGHFLLFGIAALLANRALKRKVIKIFIIFVPLGPAIITLIVFTEEFLQRFSQYRSSSYTDLIADICGILFFYYLDKHLVQKKLEPATK